MTRGRITVALVCIILLSLGLSGCGGPPVSGEVVGKQYKDGYTYMTTTTVVGTNGKVSTALVPAYRPPCYRLTVADENQHKDRSVCVDPQTFADIELGDRYEEVKQ